MTQLVLSLGSNIERNKHIRFALQHLRDMFGELTCSPLYEATAVGFNGPDFYNMVVAVETELDLDEIIQMIRSIEAEAGRVRGDNGFDNRSLDIDVLLLGDADLRAEGHNIPRDEISRAAYVLKPLADILPQSRHPVCGSKFQSMWAAFSEEQQMLHPIEFNFEG